VLFVAMWVWECRLKPLLKSASLRSDLDFERVGRIEKSDIVQKMNAEGAPPLLVGGGLMLPTIKCAESSGPGANLLNHDDLASQ
jgi:hypothetical protein